MNQRCLLCVLALVGVTCSRAALPVSHQTTAAVPDRVLPGTSSQWNAVSYPFSSSTPIHWVNTAPSGTMYLSGNGGVAQSTDSGSTWAIINYGLPSHPHVTAFGFNALGEPVVGLGFRPGTGTARYSGGVWHLGQSGQDVVASENTFAFTLTKNGELLAVTGYRGDIYGSRDYGSTWSRYAGAVGSFNGVPIGSLFAATTSPTGTVWVAGESHDGAYFSTDGGHTWTVDSGLSYANGCHGDMVMVTYTKAGSLLVNRFGSSTLFRKSGGVWTGAKGLPPGQQVNTVVQNRQGELFAGVEARVTNRRQTILSGGVYKSTDDGQTWTPYGSGFPAGVGVSGLAFDRAGHLFAQTITINLGPPVQITFRLYRTGGAP